MSYKSIFSWDSMGGGGALLVIVGSYLPHRVSRDRHLFLSAPVLDTGALGLHAFSNRWPFALQI